MAKMTPRTLSGFMELLPAPQQQMERIMEVLRKTYSLYGFTPLDTPVIESSEVLLAKAGGETEKQIYRFSKGDSDLSLRFDDGGVERGKAIHAVGRAQHLQKAFHLRLRRGKQLHKAG